MSDDFNYNKIDWKVPIERSLLTNKRIDNSSMRLYLILLSYARDKITAFPSRETLAKDLGCSVRNIDLLKRKLRENNLLDWKTTVVKNKKHNTYYLLKYEPINKSVKKDFSKAKILPIKENTNYGRVVYNFKKSYMDICNNIPKNLREHIQSGWINNSNYNMTKGDKKNLEQYYKTYGADGLKKLEIGFKFLRSYLEDKIEYGLFYNTDGSELVPTISLFIKSKLQHDGIIEWAKHNLKIMLKENKNLQ